MENHYEKISSEIIRNLEMRIARLEKKASYEVGDLVYLTEKIYLAKGKIVEYAPRLSSGKEGYIVELLENANRRLYGHTGDEVAVPVENLRHL
jgi:hypothetical protein